MSGAKTEKIPLFPLWNHFKKNHEILGIGTIFQMNGLPKIHLHAASGRGKKSQVGCLRDKASDESSYITGITIDVSGGRYLR